LINSSRACLLSTTSLQPSKPKNACRNQLASIVEMSNGVEGLIHKSEIIRNRAIVSRAKTNSLKTKGLMAGAALGEVMGDPAQIFRSQIYITTT
jgi:hypothetical protein